MHTQKLERLMAAAAIIGLSVHPWKIAVYAPAASGISSIF